MGCRSATLAAAHARARRAVRPGQGVARSRDTERGATFLVLWVAFCFLAQCGGRGAHRGWLWAANVLLLDAAPAPGKTCIADTQSTPQHSSGRQLWSLLSLVKRFASGFACAALSARTKFQLSCFLPSTRTLTFSRGALSLSSLSRARAACHTHCV